MAKPKRTTIPGRRVVGKITAAKGNCGWGHEVGDTFNLSCYETDGLCGLLYYQIFPTLAMYEFGGHYPWGDPDSFSFECMDRKSAVTIELRKQPKTD